MLLGANQYVSKLLAKPEATSRLLKRLDIFKQMPNLFIDDYTFWTITASKRDYTTKGLSNKPPFCAPRGNYEQHPQVGKCLFLIPELLTFSPHTPP